MMHHCHSASQTTFPKMSQREKWTEWCADKIMPSALLLTTPIKKMDTVSVATMNAAELTESLSFRMNSSAVTVEDLPTQPQSWQSHVNFSWSPQQDYWAHQKCGGVCTSAQINACFLGANHANLKVSLVFDCVRVGTLPTHTPRQASSHACLSEGEKSALTQP